ARGSDSHLLHPGRPAAAARALAPGEPGLAREPKRLASRVRRRVRRAARDRVHPLRASLHAAGDRSRGAGRGSARRLTHARGRRQPGAGGVMIAAATITAIGAIAHAALTRTAGTARVVARLTGSTYLDAEGALVWLGPDHATLHPRAILAGAAAGDGDALAFAIDGLVPWRPTPLALEVADVATIRRGWRALLTDLHALGTPGGFGALLAGDPLTFPLEGARGAADDLARACEQDDADAAARAALPLLGVGGGLTPSGDDFVGAALFARRLLADAGAADAAAWRRAAASIQAAALERT